MRGTTIFSIVLVVSLAPVYAQGRGGRGAQPPATTQPGAPTPAARDEPGGQPPTRAETAGAAEEKIAQTLHAIRIDGREIRYTATAGTLPIRLDDGKIAARMFFVAYTKDGEDAKTRPVSFLYNGGPGAATIWPHMGSFAPQHVPRANGGVQRPPPSTLAER